MGQGEGVSSNWALSQSCTFTCGSADRKELHTLQHALMVGNVWREHFTGAAVCLET